ncbi:DUF3087 domain-containing protein, partial [Vibrio parahaemolyticus]|nr:DUF3087 domain-containing protein [Vibrio parahaemolyticus]
ELEAIDQIEVDKSLHLDIASFEEGWIDTY